MSVELAATGTILRHRYTFINKIGFGNFGTCWLVKDAQANDEDRVIKQVFIGQLDPNGSVEACKEAKLLSSLSHPHILACYDVFIDGGFMNIVTEFCNEGDVWEIIEKKRKQKSTIPERTITLWIIQLCLALCYLHDEKHVLHRDLKSKNVFLKKGQIKLGDFGIAKVLQGSMDNATSFAGTPYYMSPECLQGVGYNSKSDMWSLGCIIYECCLLEHAFAGQSLMSLMYKICQDDVEVVIPDVFGADLQLLITALLQRDPSTRPSAREVLQMQFVTTHLQTYGTANPKVSRRKGKSNSRNVSRTNSGSKVADDALPQQGLKHSPLIVTHQLNHHADGDSKLIVTQEPKKSRQSTHQTSSTQSTQSTLSTQSSNPKGNNQAIEVSLQGLTAKERLKRRKQMQADKRAAELKDLATVQAQENSIRYAADRQRLHTPSALSPSGAPRFDDSPSHTHSHTPRSNSHTPTYRNDTPTYRNYGDKDGHRFTKQKSHTVSHLSVCAFSDDNDNDDDDDGRGYSATAATARDGWSKSASPWLGSPSPQHRRSHNFLDPDERPLETHSPSRGVRLETHSPLLGVELETQSPSLGVEVLLAGRNVLTLVDPDTSSDIEEISDPEQSSDIGLSPESISFSPNEDDDENTTTTITTTPTATTNNNTSNNNTMPTTTTTKSNKNNNGTKYNHRDNTNAIVNAHSDTNANANANNNNNDNTNNNNTTNNDDDSDSYSYSDDEFEMYTDSETGSSVDDASSFAGSWSDNGDNGDLLAALQGALALGQGHNEPTSPEPQPDAGGDCYAARLARLKARALSALPHDFDDIYRYLNEARKKKSPDCDIRAFLDQKYPTHDRNDIFLVDQVVHLEMFGRG